MARAWPAMLKWLTAMHENPKLEEVDLIIRDEADRLADMAADGGESGGEGWPA